MAISSYPSNDGYVQVYHRHIVVHIHIMNLSKTLISSFSNQTTDHQIETRLATKITRLNTFHSCFPQPHFLNPQILSYSNESDEDGGTSWNTGLISLTKAYTSGPLTM